VTSHNGQLPTAATSRRQKWGDDSGDVPSHFRGALLPQRREHAVLGGRGTCHAGEEFMVSGAYGILLTFVLGIVATVLAVVGALRLAIRCREARQARRRHVAAVAVSVEVIRARQHHPYRI
jgi:hypothetical protein